MKTLADYNAYKQAVAHFLESNDCKPGGNGSKEAQSEGYFSWQPCECCQSSLGRTREDYLFARNDDTTFKASICSDCVYYLASGVLDDITMLELGLL